jgi:hypothetical protein
MADFVQQKRVVERVVENGQVLRDVDYTVTKHGPNQIVVQGYNRDQPFVMTNMTSSALKKRFVDKKKKKKKQTKKTRKLYKKKM